MPAADPAGDFAGALAPAGPQRTPGHSSVLSARSAAVTLLLLVAALFGSVLAGASPASAHAALTGSDPKQGAVLHSAPREVTLTFSEGVATSGDSVRVLDPQGKRVDTGKPRAQSGGRAVSVGLHSGLPDGTFTVAWHVVSADSHPISGAVTFAVGSPSKAAVVKPAEKGGGGLVDTLYGVARYAAYAGFIVLVGGAAFILVCRPRAASVRSTQRLVVYAWATLTAATIVQLLLRGPYTGSGGLADAFDPGGLRAVLATKEGTALVSRLLLLAGAALFVAVLFGAYARRREQKERRDLALGLGIGGTVLAVGLATTWAAAEHASTGLQPAVAMPVDVVHLLAVAGWLGGLTTLLVGLHRGPSVSRTAVVRFSRFAFACVVLIVATGAYQAWRQIGSWHALVTTSYGRLFLVKLALVEVMVVFARVSRRWTGRLAAAGTAAEEAEEETADAEVPEPVREAATVPADPRRAAQLARQREAEAATRRRRERDADPERSGLRRSVLAEASVAVAVLAVTTVLTNTEPGRTVESAAAASKGPAAVAPVESRKMDVPFDTGGKDGKGTVHLFMEPASTGTNVVHVSMTGPDGKRRSASEVRLAFTLKSKHLGPLRPKLVAFETGHWVGSDLQLPMAGDWTVDVTVRTSDIDEVTETKNVKIS